MDIRENFDNIKREISEYNEENVSEDREEFASASFLRNELEKILDKFSKEKFDFEKGTIAKLQYGKQTIVENSNFQLNAFRAFVNNDVWAYQQWFNKGLHNLQHKALSHKVTKNANGSYSFAFTVQSQAPNGAQLVPLRY